MTFQAENWNLAAVARQFQIAGQFREGQRYGSGHINDTFCLWFEQAGTPVRYILQRINSCVFKNPPALMDNIRRVTAHLESKTKKTPDFSRRVLTLVAARDGRWWHKDPDNNYWRVYLFIEKAHTCDAIESPRQAFEAAKAFGQFQKLLADLPAPSLHDTIPDFHNTPQRLARLERAVTADVANRAREARDEIEYALARGSMSSVLLDAGLPERVTHNDTKLNNVMLDDASGEGICIIDLDTVMPGLALYDFGDMVRTATSATAEDERDLSKVEMRFNLFEALTRGYLESAGTFLASNEKKHLAFAGKLITFEIGIRFLTDFLEGDTYFKVHRPGHNLDRCRSQFKLAQSIEHQEERMNKLVESLG